MTDCCGSGLENHRWGCGHHGYERRTARNSGGSGIAGMAITRSTTTIPVGDPAENTEQPFLSHRAKITPTSPHRTPCAVDGNSRRACCQSYRGARRAAPCAVESAAHYRRASCRGGTAIAWARPTATTPTYRRTLLPLTGRTRLRTPPLAARPRRPPVWHLTKSPAVETPRRQIPVDAAEWLKAIGGARRVLERCCGAVVAAVTTHRSGLAAGEHRCRPPRH